MPTVTDNDPARAIVPIVSMVNLVAATMHPTPRVPSAGIALIMGLMRTARATRRAAAQQASAAHQSLMSANATDWRLSFFVGAVGLADDGPTTEHRADRN